MEREYGVINNMELKSRFPWACEYLYLDTVPYRADAVFIRNRVPVRFRPGHFEHEGTDYVIVFCNFRRKYEELFKKSMADFERAMILEGHADYPEFCHRLLDHLRDCEEDSCNERQGQSSPSDR